MSKDKGSKNQKKSKADKSLGKKKAVSAYKSESKNTKEPSLDVFIPKEDSKGKGRGGKK
ncbi:MAG TPA: hypothetical protein PLU64_18290 [Saprospiraceae bacterium]|nr:hypothetical protein [Lewinellaceae bacterium]HQU61167.1 hypothetical protein [Saprospiraceae bacterium]